MTVWVALIPWDYRSAEVIGVFASKEAAVSATKDHVRELRASGDIPGTYQITEEQIIGLEAQRG